MLDSKIVEYIRTLLAGGHGTIAKAEVTEKLPFLGEAEIVRILREHAPEIHESEVGGIPCWRDVAAGLPEDFSARVTEIVETLRLIERPVTSDTLDLALSLAYRENFRETYALTDGSVFRRVVEAAFKGEGELFPRRVTSSVRNSPPPEGVPTTLTGRRLPTRFRDLGIPIGAELVFVHDASIVCVVANDSNKVFYKGEVMVISALAIKLMGGPQQGAAHFTYEGETLWDRRLRLEKEALDANR